MRLHSSEKKRFLLDEMFHQNASKFAIFLEYENPHSFFSFCATLCFSLINALVYGRPEHSLGEEIQYQEMVKRKKLCGFSYSKNMANFEAFH